MGVEARFTVENVILYTIYVPNIEFSRSLNSFIILFGLYVHNWGTWVKANGPKLRIMRNTKY